MKKKKIMDKRTFTFLGVRYTAPASLDENIREWFIRNAPTATIDTIPADARFTAVHAALTPSPSSPLPVWCASIAPLTRILIYYCVAAAARRIVKENGKNKKNTVFSEKMCVFPCKFPEKYVPLQYQKRKEVTIKTGGNCNSAPEKMTKNKYSVYYDRNVESCQVAEFDTLEEAIAYCQRETAGYTEVGPNDNCYEGRGNNFAYEVYEGDPIILDEDGDIAETKDYVYRTKQYYC